MYLDNKGQALPPMIVNQGNINLNVNYEIKTSDKKHKKRDSEDSLEKQYDYDWPEDESYDSQTTEKMLNRVN